MEHRIMFKIQKEGTVKRVGCKPWVVNRGPQGVGRNGWKEKEAGFGLASGMRKRKEKRMPVELRRNGRFPSIKEKSG